MAKAKAGKVITYADGRWRNGSPAILSAKSHAMWLASVAFDGARAFAGVAPDLDRHCARLVHSGAILGLCSPLTAGEILACAWEGIHRFPDQAQLYVCPMLYAEAGFVVPDPQSTHFAMAVYESPLPSDEGFSACLSSFRRPAKDMAPTEAKASCLYPNVARASREASARGFDAAVVLDPNGNVAEFGYMNLFFVADGVVQTPAANGTFLNGITRQRVISLLRDAGVEVVERAVDFAELLGASEVFATGNYGKVLPCTRLEDRAMPIGPVYRQARELYFAFAGA
jgi:branched-chain amino acid aminotransferase